MPRRPHREDSTQPHRPGRNDRGRSLNALARLAASAFGAAHAFRAQVGGARAIAVVDGGAPVRVDVAGSLLARAIEERRNVARPLLLVGDLAASPYADDPLVASAPGARFLALAVAAGSDGGVHAVGALDVGPRPTDSFDAERLDAVWSALSGLVGAGRGAADVVDAHERRVREAAALGLALGASDDVASALASGFERLLIVAQADLGAVLTVDGDDLSVERTAGLTPAEAGAAQARRIPLASPDVADLAAAGGRRLSPSLLGLDDAATLLGVPVRRGRDRDLAAVLVLGARHRGPGLGTSAFVLARAFARQLELIVERGARADEQRHLTQAILEHYGDLLERTRREVEGHTARVVRAARRFADALGLDQVDAYDLEVGAFLHDIGKLAVPVEILERPRLLTPSERASVSTHADAGDALCATLPFATGGARAVVRHHHERWDGQGYPSGLSGDAIPLGARAFALIDVYDALVTPRPYRDAWSHDATRAWIREESGTRFDPWLSEVFLSGGVADELN